MLSEKKKIMILTGAGISAASGVPTFRGSEGIWTKKYPDVEKPQDLATRVFFEKHPHKKWNWTFDMIKLVKKCRPNAAHHAVQELADICFR